MRFNEPTKQQPNRTNSTQHTPTPTFVAEILLDPPKMFIAWSSRFCDSISHSHTLWHMHAHAAPNLYTTYRKTQKDYCYISEPMWEFKGFTCKYLYGFLSYLNYTLAPLSCYDTICYDTNEPMEHVQRFFSSFGKTPTKAQHSRAYQAHTHIQWETERLNEFSSLFLRKPILIQAIFGVEPIYVLDCVLFLWLYLLRALRTDIGVGARNVAKAPTKAATRRQQQKNIAFVAMNQISQIVRVCFKVIGFFIS